MTQEDLASILEVEPEHIANIEIGRRGISLQKLILMCKYFNVNLSDMIPIEQQDDSKLRSEWVNEIIKALDKLDTEQIGMIKTMITSLLPDQK